MRCAGRCTTEWLWRDVSAGRGMSCLEWCWCRRHWTASGSGSPPRLCPLPWWRSSARGCETPEDSTVLVGRGQGAKARGLCVRSGLSPTWAPRGSADQEASGLSISAERGLEVLRDKDRSYRKVFVFMWNQLNNFFFIAHLLLAFLWCGWTL